MNPPFLSWSDDIRAAVRDLNQMYHMIWGSCGPQDPATQVAERSERSAPGTEGMSGRPPCSPPYLPSAPHATGQAEEQTDRM